MEKYLQYIPLALFSTFTLKLMATNNWSYEQGFVLLVLGLLCGVSEMGLTFKQVKELKDTIDAQNKQIAEIKAYQDHMSSSITSLRMATGVKQTGGVKF